MIAASPELKDKLGQFAMNIVSDNDMMKNMSDADRTKTRDQLLNGVVEGKQISDPNALQTLRAAAGTGFVSSFIAILALDFALAVTSKSIYLTFWPLKSLV